jgi:hypothetical protein
MDLCHVLLVSAYTHVASNSLILISMHYTERNCGGRLQHADRYLGVKAIIPSMVYYVYETALL